ncbi:energy transducer TonB [Candidatus Acidulodesulfobacterium sp. H_13]|uniref:energy transducer TonB n=1 Tax=Candidatus Acidulodesulfobacterium sp. H_13 TaxID=3395470 RepID=UPI003AF7A257
MQQSGINSKGVITKTIAIILSVIINLGVSWGFVRFLNISAKNGQNRIDIYLASIPLSSNSASKDSKRRTSGDKAVVIPVFHKAIKQDKKPTGSRIKSNFFNVTNRITEANPIRKDTQNGKISYFKIKQKKESSLRDHINGYVDIKKFPKIKGWIEKHKFYPREAIFEQEEGVVRVTFLIGRNRHITDINITKKSPYRSLNEAALKILKTSSPIPVSFVSNINLPIYVHINIFFRLV